MANKPHALQAAVQVAQSREDTAAKLLAEFQQRIVEQQTRLQQLLLFRGEYATQFQNEGCGGMSPRRFQNYAAFLNNLDQGITQSRQQLDRLQQELQHKRQMWVQTHARTKALEEVIERNRKVQLRLEDHREQRDNDEGNLQRSICRRQTADGDGI